MSCSNWRFCSRKTFLLWPVKPKEIHVVFSSSSFPKSIIEIKLFIMLPSTFVSCIKSVLANYRLLGSRTKDLMDKSSHDIFCRVEKQPHTTSPGWTKHPTLI